MTAADHLRYLIAVLPEGARVTFSRAELRELLASEVESGVDALPPSNMLTPKEVANVIRRSPSRVRDLRAAGHFPNAEWNGREYMTPRSDVAAYLAWRSQAYPRPKRRKNATMPTPDRVADEPDGQNTGRAAETPVDTAADAPTNLSGWRETLRECLPVRRTLGPDAVGSAVHRGPRFTPRPPV